MVPAIGNKRPLLKDLYDHVVLEVADKWRDLGVQLLGHARNHQGVLKVIAADHPHDVTNCCKRVLEKWLDANTGATWNQLIEALKSPGIQQDYLAGQIEKIIMTKCKATVHVTGGVSSQCSYQVVLFVNQLCIDHFMPIVVNYSRPKTTL